MDIAASTARRAERKVYGATAALWMPGRMPMRPPSRMPAGRDKANKAGPTSSAVESARAGSGPLTKNSAIIPYSKINTVMASKETAAGADRRLAFATHHPITTQKIATMKVCCTSSVQWNKSGSISLNRF